MQDKALLFLEDKKQDDPDLFIKWLLAFYHQDLKLLTSDEQKTLARILLVFFWSWYRKGGDSNFLFHPKDNFSNITKRQLHNIHGKIRGCLSMLLPINYEQRFDDDMWTLPVTYKHIFLVRTNVCDGKLPHIISRRYSAGWPDGFYQAVACLLEKYGSYLRRCEECTRIFLKSKRQVYCSKACSQRVRTRRWYAKNRDKVIEKRHQAYVLEVKRKIGPNVRVDRRRPRKPNT